MRVIRKVSRRETAVCTWQGRRRHGLTINYRLMVGRYIRDSTHARIDPLHSECLRSAQGRGTPTRECAGLVRSACLLCQGVYKLLREKRERASRIVFAARFKSWRAHMRSCVNFLTVSKRETNMPLMPRTLRQAHIALAAASATDDKCGAAAFRSVLAEKRLRMRAVVSRNFQVRRRYERNRWYSTPALRPSNGPSRLCRTSEARDRDLRANAHVSKRTYSSIHGGGVTQQFSLVNSMLTDSDGPQLRFNTQPAPSCSPLFASLLANIGQFPRHLCSLPRNWCLSAQRRVLCRVQDNTTSKKRESERCRRTPGVTRFFWDIIK